MTLLSESALSQSPSMQTPKLITSADRSLLTYLHSGEFTRDFLPKLLRISAVILLISYTLYWLSIWQWVYQEFERWGLVRAFCAQIIALATAFFVTKITLLRAKHLEALPADDFVILRALSVLCRWFAEVALVFVLGMGLSSFLQPLSPLMSTLAESTAASQGSREAPQSMISGIISGMAALVVTPLFLILYALATAIDLSLAVEFNTRAERVGKELL